MKKNEFIKLDDVIKMLDMLASSEASIISYIITHADDNFMFLGSYKEMERELGVSPATITKTIKKMKENNLLEDRKKGIWYVSLLQTENLQYSLDGTVEKI